MELGAGTGVPGLTALLYTAATHVTFTDLFKHTMDNLAFNVDANLKTASPGRTKDDTEVCVYDWVKYTSLAAGSFDVILGSDLVYDIAAAELLTQVIEHLLTPTGTFLMVAGEGRQGVPELQAKMETHGFVVTQSPAPEEYMANPLVSQDNAELQLHFNELEDNKFHLYTFRRSSKSGCVPNKLPTFERPYQPLFMCLHMCSHLAVELCANNLRYFSHADGVAMPMSVPMSVFCVETDRNTVVANGTPTRASPNYSPTGILCSMPSLAFASNSEVFSLLPSPVPPPALFAQHTHVGFLTLAGRTHVNMEHFAACCHHQLQERCTGLLRG